MTTIPSRTQGYSRDEEVNDDIAAQINNQRNLELYAAFTDFQSDAIIQSKSVKMNSYADWEFTVTIPKSFLPDLVELTAVVGMPIRIHIEKIKYDG